MGVPMVAADYAGLCGTTDIVKNLDIKTIPIASFPLLGQQTLKQLVNIVPSLNQFPAHQIQPISALLSQKGLNSDSPLSTLLAQNPNLGEIKLNEIDLSQYAIADIHNIESVQLGQFQGWQDTLIADVPALNALPLDSFPVPLTELGSAIDRAHKTSFFIPNLKVWRSAR